MVGRGVYVSESFPLPLARKLELAMTGALQHAGQQQAALPDAMPAQSLRSAPAMPELSAGLASWLHSCGMLRAAMAK